MEHIRTLLKTYAIELLLSFVACVAMAGSVIFAVTSSKKPHETIRIESATQEKPQPTPEEKNSAIWVDISGAVNRPGTYELSAGARLDVALKEAGGLSELADTDFYFRNYNNARLLIDQEKIYIPRIDEIQQGIFVEGSYYIDHSLQRTEQKGLTSSPENSTTTAISGKVSINSGSLDELDTLPGIGKVTAQKIIDNRPYGSLQELIDKKSIGQSVFDKIESLIVLE
jgi:competence protein ComEA